MSDYEVVPNLDPRASYGFSVGIGSGHSLVPKPPSVPNAATPKPYPSQTPSYHGGNVALAESTASAEPALGISFLALPIYPWMLLVGILVYACVSAQASLFPQGLHLHPIFGAAAFLGAIWLYRQLMSCWPTAILLAVPSVVATGLLAWSISDAASFRHFGMSLPSGTLSLPLLWQSIRWSALDKWAVVSMAVMLAAHISYWRERRETARTSG
ncbi:MAG: hypothetical protein U0Q16_08485 [Bryobacteraceae bacterium]